MRQIKLGKLYHWQSDALKCIRDSYGTGKLIFIKSVRQVSGKTFLLMNALVCCAYDKPGCKSLLIEPVNSQNDRVFNDICRACKPLIKNANKSTKEIVFDNDSIIYLRSAESGDSIRGTTVTGICCVDEACYISDDFINTMLPVITKHKAPCIFASSPALCVGFFFENYSLGLSGTVEKIVAFNWTDYISEMYTEDELAFFKRTYSERKFRTEILGEFTSTDGALFTNIENCIKTASHQKDLYFGIDWAVGGNDRTVVTCFNRDKEMVFIWMTNELTPTEQVDEISKLINHWNPIKVTVESNSIGSVFFDMLQSKVKQRIVKFNTSNKTKNQIIERLIAAFESEDIGITSNEELLLELRMYRSEVTKGGAITYNAPSGYNDDAVMSTAIAYDSISSNKGHYCVSFVGSKPSASSGYSEKYH